MVHGHSKQIFDVKFAPFDRFQFATGSDDCTVKVWQIPDDDNLSGTTEIASLSGHKRGVNCIEYNPSFANVLASGSADGTVRVWSVTEQKQLFSVDFGEKSAVEGLSWSPDGARLAVICKDKKLRVVDVRKEEVVQEAAAHEGTKASRVVWLGDTGYIVTSGFSKMRERQLKIWKADDIGEKPLKTHSIDTSTGVIDMQYDEDAKLLFACGTGDSSVRCFEVMEAAPYLFEMTAARSDKPTKGFCLLPKRAVSVMTCEVDRVFKVQENAVVPISYIVPRKSKRAFSDIEELFPPTRGDAAKGDVAQWLEGHQGEAARVSMDPDSSHAAAIADVTTAAAPSVAQSSRPIVEFVPSAAPVNIDRSITSAETGQIKAVVMKTDAEKAAEAAAKEKASHVVSKKTLAARKLIRSTHYRHVSGKQVKDTEQFHGLRHSASAGFARQIIANATYFGVPLAGNGGSLAVVRHLDVGRVPLEVPRVESGAQLCDFDFSPHDDHLLLTGLDNARIKVFKLPSSDESREGLLCDSSADLRGHQRRITTARWHPIASELIVATGLDGSLRVFDVLGEKECVAVTDAHPDTVLSQTCDYQGSVYATSCKDRKLRLIDPRAGKVVGESEIAHQGAKSFRAVWMGRHDRIFTAGFSKSSERECAVWDIRKLDKWMGRTGIDVSSGVIEPVYDEDTNVTFVSGRGDTTVRLFEAVEKPHFLTQFSGGEPAVGVAALPKSVVDVRGVELRRFVKLTSTGRVVPIRFFVPRTRVEFFQDDIYPPTRASEPGLTGPQWLSGDNADPPLFDLQPSDMTPLSEAPKIEKKAPKYRLEEKVEKKETTEELFHRMNALTGIASIEDKVLQEQEGVDESEWDDDSVDEHWTPGMT
eukprot:CAMPEP_0168598580 /NCGR_PEP_ID=MMETSP0420-20121227/11498_1 /TAXON_ID=498008 /ORGANISM="Pessonella sp." /LENGTH=871 /DNA_ID=CAMNT_0008635957 /DNA_START=159 /DNA_END=2774 /DNA_ORIENTATION=+